MTTGRHRIVYHRIMRPGRAGDPEGVPWPRAPVRVQQTGGSYTLDETRPAAQDTYYADEDGALRVSLWCTEDGAVPTSYRWTLPSGEAFTVSLPYGDGSPISLTTLREMGVVPGDPTYPSVLALAEAALEQVREGTIRTESVIAERGAMFGGGVRVAARHRRPLISFIDDDGPVQSFTELRPMLDVHGYKTGMAIIAGLLGQTLGAQSIMTAAQVREMAQDGHEVLSHTYTHRSLPTLSLEEVEGELLRARDTLRSMGFNPQGFVAPGNATTSEIRRLIDRYYRANYATRVFYRSSLPLTEHARNAMPLLDELNVTRVQYAGTSDFTLADYTGMVDAVAASGGWLIFTLHTGLPSYWDANHKQWFPKLLAHIAATGVEVVTPGRGLDVYGAALRQGNASDFDSHFAVTPDGRVYSSDLDARWVVRHAASSSAPGYSDQSVPADFPPARATVVRFATAAGAVFPGAVAGTLVHHAPSEIPTDTGYVWQEWYPNDRDDAYRRTWDRSTGAWRPWQPIAPSVRVAALRPSGADPITAIEAPDTVSYASYSSAQASAAGLPTYGILITYRPSSGTLYNARQVLLAHDGLDTYERHWQTGSTSWSAWRHNRERRFARNHNFGTVAAGESKTVEFLDLDGVSLGDVVLVGRRTSAVAPSGVLFDGWVSANKAVTLRAANLGPGSASLPTTTYTITVLRSDAAVPV
jgi:peptidoglycan/xylan/chitin deacetylase (PgdA/CDA1 family)